METFTLTIELGNDAMQTPYDIAAALERVARQIRDEQTLRGIIRDDNGNHAGEFDTE